MARRILGPKGSKKRRRFFLGPILITAAVALVFSIAAAAGPVGTASGFEDDDGNLVPNGTALTNCTSAHFDWNCFRTLTWNGTAPYQNASTTANGWQFKGLTDALKSGTDTGFKGGTKQDDNCAGVIGTSAPNKDDLKRIYLASTIGSNGHVYLDLAWVRIPLNTTSSSAHVGFEFNQSTTACPSGSDGLVQRTAGDLLIVYDFEGSSTGIPNLTYRRWIVAPTTTLCEVSGKVPPAGTGCWGPAQGLTSSGFAEGKVNSGSTALDCLAPSTDCTSATSGTKETLGNAEFGEAGIDLTGAGIFTSGQCTSFGQVEGVSRSSGNSGSAAMEDLVGPGSFRLANCGEIKIIKHTDPRGGSPDFSYTSTGLDASGISCTQTLGTGGSFTLNDSGNTTTDSSGNTQDCTSVPTGNYTVTEGSDPTGYSFHDFSCSVTGSNGSTATPSSSTTQRNVSISSVGTDLVTCTYTNTLQTGALKISKTSTKTGNALAGAHFTITKDGTAISQTPAAGYFTTDSGGNICVDGLVAGDYVATETQAPTGFSIDTTAGQTVSVSGNNAKCTDATYTGATQAFTDSPLSDIQVNFKDDGSGETNGANTTIVCDGSGNGTDSTTAAPGWDKSLTRTNIKTGSSDTVINCTITIDP